MLDPILDAVLNPALDLVLPRTCPGCGRPEPWCPSCAATLTGRPREPVLPDATLDGWPGRLPAVRALSRYRGPARAAVVAAKERGRRDLQPLLGAAVGRGLSAMIATGLLPGGELWLVPAPTRRSQARARGGDPVTAMARAAAGVLTTSGRACEVAPCLVTAARARDSVGLDAAGRAANLAGKVRFDRRASVPAGSAVVLIDDVLTTGATAAAATGTLSACGFTVLAVLTVAAVPPWRVVR